MNDAQDDEPLLGGPLQSDPVRARLRAADPAAGLAPLPAMRSTALLDRATTGAAAPPRRRLRALAGGLAAAALVATAVVLLLPRPPAPVLTLALAPTDVNAICAPLPQFAAAALQGSQVALVGTVTAVGDGEVVVRPDRFFRGGPASEVRLRAGAGGGAALDGADLRTGQQVLVAATDRLVAPCGLSAPESPALLEYYEHAFG